MRPLLPPASFDCQPPPPPPDCGSSMRKQWNSAALSGAQGAAGSALAKEQSWSLHLRVVLLAAVAPFWLSEEDTGPAPQVWLLLALAKRKQERAGAGKPIACRSRSHMYTVAGRHSLEACTTSNFLSKKTSSGPVAPPAPDFFSEGHFTVLSPPFFFFPISDRPPAAPAVHWLTAAEAATAAFRRIRPCSAPASPLPPSLLLGLSAFFE